MDRSRVLLPATVARFVVVALFFDSLAPLFPVIARDHALSDAAFQALLGACFLVFALAQLLSVPVIRRIGLHHAAGLSCLYLGAAAAVICTSGHPAVFAVLFVSLFGVNSIGSNATRVALRNVTSDEGFRRLFAWASSFVELMQTATPVLAGAIAAAFGWRWAVVALVAPVVLAGAVIEWSTVRHRSPHPNPQTAGAYGGWRTVLSRRTFLIPTLMAAALQISFAPLLARLPFLAANDLGLGPFGVGVVLCLDSVVVALGLLVCGLLAKRLATRAKALIGCAILLGGVVLMVSSLWTTPWFGVAGILLATAAFGFIYIPCASEALNGPETERVTASALFGFLQPVVAGISVGLGSLLPLSLLTGGALMTALALVLTTLLAALWRTGPAPATGADTDTGADMGEGAGPPATDTGAGPPAQRLD
ncbi:MFS transporter [Phaeovibrio sulfidiphilus]|uniref:MFS transporter n=1 Tax=Phaeovibrio sulfidiphilus TaxID=1220600 RepID=A0A8J6YUL7_9PROT|nr:MFS transporter [Phaeovibrio sulfidiphilus]MBE1236042.1 MFS transporter [Phaeovibrio sulfidiphilus]